ncbi:GNAT family N-acetyltransferase [Citromicrobium bathyomarinum]|uniref:GNAT family N-acetyltransferase n=1 Tax=Citromicrobium bathyomarinum TaxID=72174 RepID=UPI00315A07E7
MAAISPDRIVVRRDDLTGGASRSLIELHLRGMHEHSPPDAIFALDLSGLRRSDVEVWSAWVGEAIAGIGALKKHSDRRGEIKSMRTHPDFLRRGVADALLGTIVERARLLGLRTLSLETGSGPGFDPAIRFYRARGFEPGGPFGDYTESAFNQFFHRTL